MGDRLEQAREAYTAIEQGDYETALKMCKEDFLQHIPSLGMTIEGVADFRERVIPMNQQIELKQRLTNIFAEGDFVITTVEATSTLRPETGTIVYVARYEGDKVAEMWAITPPLPEGASI